jgi:hypothetical protein
MTSFGEYISKRQSEGCRLCLFFNEYPSEATGIREGIAKRGLRVGRSRVGISKNMIADYIRERYPAAGVSYESIKWHFSNGHEEIR